MVIEINSKSLKDLYTKAKYSFNSCVENPENNFLKDEINIEMDDILLEEEFIKVRFVKSELDKFILEVKLTLISPNGNPIGEYFYYEDEEGVGIDDSLVFNSKK